MTEEDKGTEPTEPIPTAEPEKPVVPERIEGSLLERLAAAIGLGGVALVALLAGAALAGGIMLAVGDDDDDFGHFDRGGFVGPGHGPGGFGPPGQLKKEGEGFDGMPYAPGPPPGTRHGYGPPDLECLEELHGEGLAPEEMRERLRGLRECVERERER